MITLCITYRLNPDRLDDFHAYGAALQPIVDRCGGHFVAYYVPTKIAGSTETGIGLIDFASLSAYEQYRDRIARDPEAVAVLREAANAGCILGESRAFLERAHASDAAPPRVAAQEDVVSPVERVYFAWNQALADNDPDRLLSLYAVDAVLESPLIPYLLGVPRGILRGHNELQPLFTQLAKRKPAIRQYYRTGYLTDGKRLIWEYPRNAPNGEQMDFAEAMDVDGHGLIQRHCVYWGWLGVGVLQRDEYYREI